MAVLTQVQPAVERRKLGPIIGRLPFSFPAARDALTRRSFTGTFLQTLGENTHPTPMIPHLCVVLGFVGLVLAGAAVHVVQQVQGVHQRQRCKAVDGHREPPGRYVRRLLQHPGQQPLRRG